ncbi:hypothetical protein SLNWT_3317 [Streptomyces albus]|uniref:Uncharacterized protein n=1 Tax=Streptomyces albus (strain ATCC 21838 / DSM 41398 / FERM P-419 / JCM 4703 / NBRC 107858) TaxID=1081613 RepID=A0A0B5EMJ0_STRA4|nr:hypothetical protein SLNWT_3317 [Streptomyces albus]AYN33755.1 hypothetical protein DUI70_3254 [Streptomyces albus]
MDVTQAGTLLNEGPLKPDVQAASPVGLDVLPFSAALFFLLLRSSSPLPVRARGPGAPSTGRSPGGR